jgi:hypothetical protein
MPTSVLRGPVAVFPSKSGNLAPPCRKFRANFVFRSFAISEIHPEFAEDPLLLARNHPVETCSGHAWRRLSSCQISGNCTGNFRQPQSPLA